MDMKKCSRCQEEKSTNDFRNENKQCNSCCDKANERKKQYRIKNPEKVALQQKKKIDQIRHETIYCPLCEYSVKKYKFKQHENSVGHQYILNCFEDGVSVDKPDKTKTDNEGRVWYGCNACEEFMLQCMWGSHIASTTHDECKENAMDNMTTSPTNRRKGYNMFFGDYNE